MQTQILCTHELREEESHLLWVCGMHRRERNCPKASKQRRGTCIDSSESLPYMGKQPPPYHFPHVLPSNWGGIGISRGGQFHLS